MVINKNKNYYVYTGNGAIYFVKGKNLEISDGILTMTNSLFKESVCTKLYPLIHYGTTCDISIPLSRISELIPVSKDIVPKWTTLHWEKAEKILRRYERFYDYHDCIQALKRWWQKKESFKNRKDKNA